MRLQFNIILIYQEYNIKQINIIDMDNSGERLKLATGDQMPILGLGTWKIPKDVCSDAVYNAIKAGYRLIDCACDYGNEHKVGEGVKKAIDEGIVTRKQLWITSKLWNTFHRPEHVEPACKRSLSDLGLQYLDLYLIHFPISLKYVDPAVRYPPEWLHDPNSTKPCMVEDHVPIIDTWRSMQQLVKKGLVRNIGVSNFNVSLLRDLINSCDIRPSVLQIELHPLLTQKKLLKYCKSKQILITAYSSFGATSYVELGATKPEDSLTQYTVVKELAQKYKKSPAQILLKWAVQQHIAIIPKTVNKDRLKQNGDVFNWALEQSDFALLDGLNQNRRYNDPGAYCQFAFHTFFPIYE